ncbi:MAG: hypothetical protein R3F61_27645 [Myxococcota bacterium]
MSDFHYVRTLGRDGGVDVCSGQAIGEELGRILEDGLPPFNVALQIIAGLCEVLDITEEDDVTHGNISLEQIFIDDTGAISLEGFGQTRTRAPEGKPRGPMTDLYGLGYVAYRLLGGEELAHLPTDDAVAHDDTVIDAILKVDFEGLNEEMVGDVQWFLAKLMAFDREDRPPAVECWRTFVAFADEAEGPDFVNWCLEALDGGGQRRIGGGEISVGPSVGAAGHDDDEGDDLDGPLVSRGPLQRGGLSFDPGALAGGTAFFSRDDLKAALDRQEPQKPAAGGGSATNYWSRDELQAMAEDGGAAAPRPKRAKGEGERRKTMALQKKDLQGGQQGASSATKPARNEQRAPAAPPPPAPPAPAPPVPTPPRQPSSPPVAASPPPLSSSFREAEAFEGAEPTIRMQAQKVRTTRTPAPAPQVFRPGVGTVPPADAPSMSSRSKPSDIETAVQDPAELEAAFQEAERERAAAKAAARKAEHAQLPVEPPVPTYQPAYEDEPADDSNFNLVLIGGIALVLVIGVVACMGLGGSAGVVALLSQYTGVETPVQQPDPAPVPLPAPVLPTPEPVDPEPVKPEPTKPGPTRPSRPTPTPSPGPSPGPSSGPKPSPGPSPTTRPSPTPSPTTRPTPTPSPTRPSPGGVRPQPTPEPVADPVPADGPVTLTLKSRDRGKLMCPGVANKDFDGNTLLNIEPYQLPATCMVVIEGQREAFQVKGTGSVTCNLVNAKVSCDRAFVP